MNCLRCQGLMVQDLFYDFEGTSGHTWSQSQRCMNCGHAHDRVMEQNRVGSLKKAVPPVSSEPDYHDEEVHLGAESYLAPAA
jgi:hypothetical protein